MAIIHDLLGYDGIKIFQDTDKFSFSLDSILLADFVKPKFNTKKIIDLGCGNAPISLFLTMKTKALITGIELQEEVYDLAKASVAYNKLEDKIELYNEDIKGIYKQVGNGRFDIAVSNPPFFKYTSSSIINKNDYLTIARHEVKINLEEIIKESQILLKSGGSLYMIHRCERLEEVILLLNKYNFGLKKLRFIYTNTKLKESKMFLFEARLNQPSDVVVDKPLYIYNDDGSYTSEVREIFNFQIPI